MAVDSSSEQTTVSFRPTLLVTVNVFAPTAYSISVSV